MSKISIFHNPRCSKSRQTLQLLNDNGVEPEIIEYLKVGMTADTVKSLMAQLNLSPRQFMRVKETEYKEQSLGNSDITDADLIAAIVATPKLLERPIVVNGDKAAIGRPPENVLEII
ncbi:arsenate reductase (glutaredoxin) [Psychrobium sp. nBUS_13]|uniref:arsenate reductase (glutaredoxin) n=1 Tax=Psychrobium sp. nBUS_13 TaxID=3395319 RepID=UPI003EBB6656